MLTWIFGIALSIGSASAASSDCLNIKFDNWDSVCLGISKNGSRNFRISIDKNNLSKNASLTCRILLPNEKIYPLSTCEGTFPYNWTSTQTVVVYATYSDKNNNSHFKRQQAKVNFNNGSWGSSSNVVSSSSYSSSYNDEIDLSTNRKSPSTSQYVNLTIKTDRNYTGKLYFSAKYRRYSSDSWSSISNTSSSYFNDYSSEWSNEYYKMTSSDRGNVTLNSLVKFRKDGYYRIYVKDTDGNESYIQFDVGDAGSSSSYNDDLSVSVSPSNPDTYDWVKLTITTDDDYTGKINFSKFQYRSSSSSSWSSISRTSSTYVSDYSSDWSNGYYRMTSSDDGEAILKNLIKFKKSGYYRIYVEDTDRNESYVQIDVDVSSSSSRSSDKIQLSTNRKSPSTSQYINLTIDTDSSRYSGKLYLSAKYRSSSSAGWSSISNTSSTYFNDYSSDWSRGYYKMTTSDKWNVSLNSLVKFRKNWYYRIYVEDINGNESYIQFSVWNIDDDDKSDVNGFSTTQLDKVKKIYKEWNSMVSQMQRQYPYLKKDSYWIRMSENFYDSMKDVINNKKSRNFDDYEDFQEAFDDWYKYTLKNI